MSRKRSFGLYTYSETKTAGGQLLEFTCHPDDVSSVKEFISNKVRSVSIPCSKQISIGHGGYGRYSRYDMTQHDYAGGGPDESGHGGYIEVLKIKNPPENRCGFVLHEYNTMDGHNFTEWKSLRNARFAFKKRWGGISQKTNFEKMTGFIRYVRCGALTPWFYAIGDECILGDYAFPDGLQDDPVYRFGRQFVVEDKDGILSVKVCMGTRFLSEESEYGRKSLFHYRRVYWNDGSFWDDSHTHVKQPRPLEDKELWIAEAMQQFQRLLSGHSTEFSIDFIDGTHFVGKMKKKESKLPCASGDYLLEVHTSRQTEPKVGWVRNFKPTPEHPDIVQLVKAKFQRQPGEEVTRIEVKKSKVEKGGKKWTGVFHSPSGG